MKKIIIVIMLLLGLVGCNNKKDEILPKYVYEEEGFGKFEMGLELPIRTSTIDLYVFYQSEDEAIELELRYLAIKSNVEIYYAHEKAYYESKGLVIEEEYITSGDEGQMFFLLLEENRDGKAEAIWYFETDGGLVRMISLEGDMEVIQPCIKEIEESFEAYEGTYSQLIRIQAETTYDHLEDGELPYKNLWVDSSYEAYGDANGYVAVRTLTNPKVSARDHHYAAIIALEERGSVIFYEDEFRFGSTTVYRLAYINPDDSLEPYMHLLFETTDGNIVEIDMREYMNDLIDLQNHALEFAGLTGDYEEIIFPYTKKTNGFVIDEPGHMYVSFTDDISIRESLSVNYIWYYSMQPDVIFESHVHAVDGNYDLWRDILVKRLELPKNIVDGMQTITLSGKQVDFFEGEIKAYDVYFSYWVFEEKPGIVRTFLSYGDEAPVKQVIEDVNNSLIIYDTPNAAMEYERNYLDYATSGYSPFSENCNFKIPDKAVCYGSTEFYAIIETRTLSTNQTVETVYQNAVKKAKESNVVVEEIKTVGNTKIYHYMVLDSDAYAGRIKGYVYCEDQKGNLLVFEFRDDINYYPYLVKYFLAEYGIK